jgi:phage terminase large subunit-like protein
MEGRECHLALDLASKTDLAAVALVFPGTDDDGRTTYRVRPLLPERRGGDGGAQPVLSRLGGGRLSDRHAWQRDGLRADRGRHPRLLPAVPGAERGLRSVGFDAARAAVAGEGAPMVEFRASTQNFSEPTKELDAAIRSGRLKHDGNPVLEWCVGNVVGRYDARANVYPRKQRPEQKIDAAVALIMALGRAIFCLFSHRLRYLRCRSVQ